MNVWGGNMYGLVVVVLAMTVGTMWAGICWRHCDDVRDAHSSTVCRRLLDIRYFSHSMQYVHQIIQSITNLCQTSVAHLNR